MSEIELDHAAKWAVPPAPGLALHGRNIAARLLDCPVQYLVSGDLAAFARGSGDVAMAGATRTAGQTYALRVARDRLLVVGPVPGIAPGWNPGGFAVSEAGAALAVIEISGAGLAGLIAQATTLDIDNAGPSAATAFAGVPAIVDLSEDVLRLHVDRGLTAYIWSWLARTLADLAA